MSVQERLERHLEQVRGRKPAAKPGGKVEAETGGKSDVHAKEGEVISASDLKDKLPPIRKIRTNKLGGGDYMGHDHGHTTVYGHVHVHKHEHEHTDGTRHNHAHEHTIHDHPPGGQKLITQLYNMGNLAKKREAVRARVSKAEAKVAKGRTSASPKVGEAT
jgi:hypothetical protein